MYVLHLDAHQTQRLLDVDGHLEGAERFSIALPRGGADTPGHAGLCLIVVENAVRDYSGPAVSHCARVRYSGNITSFEFRLMVTGLRPLSPPLPIEDITKHVQARHRSKVSEVLGTSIARLIPPAAGREILSALEVLRPGEARAMYALNADPIIRSDEQGERWRHDRDAVRLSLRLAGMDDKRAMRLWREPESGQPFLSGLSATSSEASLIDHDARHVPGWWEARKYAAHISSFTDGSNTLEVINVNVTGVEGITGSDLIYYAHGTGSLIFVQYKKLDNGGKFHPNQRFYDQLDRLEAVQSLGKQDASARAWRLGNHTTWVKLAKAGPFESDNTDMVKGQYLPVNLVRTMLKDDCTLGERGGRVLGYGASSRHFDNSTFTNLVKQGWIGTAGVELSDILDLGKRQVDEGRSVVIALESRRDESAMDTRS